MTTTVDCIANTTESFNCSWIPVPVRLSKLLVIHAHERGNPLGASWVGSKCKRCTSRLALCLTSIQKLNPETAESLVDTADVIQQTCYSKEPCERRWAPPASACAEWKFQLGRVGTGCSKSRLGGAALPSYGRPRTGRRARWSQ